VFRLHERGERPDGVQPKCPYRLHLEHVAEIDVWASGAHRAVEIDLVWIRGHDLTARERPVIGDDLWATRIRREHLLLSLHHRFEVGDVDGGITRDGLVGVDVLAREMLLPR